jgi:serine phosphatase RsbU (regulator of sigma subunit)
MVRTMNDPIATCAPPAPPATAGLDAARHRLAEALGLQPHYAALDRLLVDHFGVARWVNCLTGDDGDPLPVAAGAPGDAPGSREVRLLAEIAGAGRDLLPGLSLDELPAGVLPLPDGAAPYRLAVVYPFRHRTLGALLIEPADPGATRPADLTALATLAADQFAPLCFREHTIEQVFQEKALFTAKLDYLAEMGRLAGEADLKSLLNKIMELTMDFAGAEVGSLVLIEDGQPVTRLDWGLPHEVLLALTDLQGEPLIFQAVDRPEPLWLAPDAFLAPPQSPYQIERLVILPLHTRDSWLGAVCLVTSAGNPEFHPAKLDGLGAGLSLAATAVENARLFQVKLERERELRNMEIASDIQQALLPRSIPDLEGVAVVGTNVAARMIGGDYYDFFPFPDGSLGVIVADVAGKGVAASLIMTSTRMLIRSIAAPEVAVEEVIRRTNLLLQAEACGGQFVTANYVRIDPRRLTMEICTAGHEPVFVYRPGEARFIFAQSRALPLGITPDAVYTRETIALEPEDLIFLYTDGVNESMNKEREQFGIVRLQDTISAAYPDTPEAIMQTILTAVDWHSAGMPRHDDTTIVVAQVRAGEDPDSRGGVVSDNEQP